MVGTLTYVSVQCMLGTSYSTWVLLALLAFMSTMVGSVQVTYW